MVSWGNGYPATLSQWRYEFDSRWDRIRSEPVVYDMNVTFPIYKRCFGGIIFSKVHIASI